MAFSAVHADYVTRARGYSREFLTRYGELKSWRALAALNGLPSGITTDDLIGANGNVTVADVQALETLLAAIDAYIAANPTVIASVSKIAIPDATS